MDIRKIETLIVPEIVVGDSVEAIMQEAFQHRKEKSPAKDWTYICLRDRLWALVPLEQWNPTIRRLCDELDY